MKFVDANIFLELMLDDKKADICESFFEKIKNEETSFYTSDFIIYTCLLQIEQKIKSLKIMEDEITKDVSIVISDFAHEDELDESKLLWENQISDLKHVLGSV